MRRIFARAATDNGFSLLEMIAVLAVLAMVTAIALPEFSGTIAQERLNQAGMHIAYIMTTARAQAHNRNVPVDVIFDLRRRSFYTPGGRAYALDDHISVRVIAGLLRGSNVKDEKIRFYPDGSASGGRITLATADRSRSLDISWLTGRTSWWRD